MPFFKFEFVNCALRVIGLATLFVASTASADTVNVGVLGSFSGPYAAWGTQFRNALELFQEQHSGKVGDHEVKLVYRDVGGNEPTRAKQLAQELVIREHVQYLIGLEFTPTVLAVADVINQAKIPFVIFNSGTSSVMRQSPFYVRTGFTQWAVADPIASYAAEHGKKKAVIAVADYAPGYDALESFRHGFTQKGGQIVEEVKIPMGTNDFSSYMLRIKDAAPDSVFMFMPVGPMSVGFIKSYVDRGLLASGISLYAGAETQETDMQPLGDAAIGIQTALHYGPYLDNPENKKFFEGLTAKHGAAGLPNLASVAAYDGLAVVYHMIDATKGQKNGQAAMESIKGYAWNSPRGPVSIDAATRDIVQNIYIRQVEKGPDGKVYNKVTDTIKDVKDPWAQLNPK
jgi:branched-chain amino acid transport system substrate-binding protein